jgi:hypothetical protein
MEVKPYIFFGLGTNPSVRYRIANGYAIKETFGYKGWSTESQIPLSGATFDPKKRMIFSDFGDIEITAQNGRSQIWKNVNNISRLVEIFQNGGTSVETEGINSSNPILDTSTNKYKSVGVGSKLKWWESNTKLSGEELYFPALPTSLAEDLMQYKKNSNLPLFEWYVSHESKVCEGDLLVKFNLKSIRSKVEWDYGSKIIPEIRAIEDGIILIEGNGISSNFPLLSELYDENGFSKYSSYYDLLYQDKSNIWFKIKRTEAKKGWSAENNCGGGVYKSILKYAFSIPVKYADLEWAQGYPERFFKAEPNLNSNAELRRRYFAELLSSIGIKVKDTNEE